MTDKAAKAAQEGKTDLARLLPGLLVSAAAIVALYFFVDLEKLGAALRLADYRLLPIYTLVFIGTLVARSLAWRTILEEKASFRDSFFVINQAYLLNNVLPFRLGELGRALLLSGRTSLGFWRVLSTVIVERVFDVAFAAGLLLGTLPFVVGGERMRGAGLWAGGLVVAGFGVLFVMGSFPKQTIGMVERFTRLWPKLQAWLGEKVAAFLEGLATLKDPRRFLLVTLLMLLTWTFNVAWYYLLMLAFVPQATPLWALFSIAVASLGVALPSSPAYIGVLEGALVAGLGVFGVDPSIALAYALVAHALYLVMTGIFGVIGFGQQGQSLSTVYRQLLRRSTQSEARK